MNLIEKYAYGEVGYCENCKNCTNKAEQDLKILRDKLNSSIPLAADESEEMLLEQWNQMHAEMEALKAEDERNYVECRG